MNPLLQVSQVTKTYGSVIALSGFSQMLAEGEHTALVGPSGCGKSTLLRLIAGLDAPDSGSIFIEDRTVTNGPRILVPPHRRGLAMVFQDLALWPNLTALANVELGLALAPGTRIEKRTRARDALALCRIAELAHRKPAQLSGGQQQRVALARALAVRPKLLLLDEPFTGLDDTLKEQLIADIRVLVERHGVTLLAVTHDETEAAGLKCALQKMSHPRG